MLGSAVPLHDEAGKVRGCIGAFLDITARLQTEQALQQLNTELEQRVHMRTADLDSTVRVLEQEVRDRLAAEQGIKAERQRLFDVLETLPAMVSLLRENHTVAFANRSFRERFGSPEGMRCHELCFGRPEACEVCESFKPLKTGLPHQWEVTIPGDRLLEVHNFPFTDVDGTRMILEMDFDITERRRAEADVKAAHAELAARAEQLRALAGDLTLSEQRERRRLAEVLHDDLQQLLVGAKFRLVSLNRFCDQAAKAAAAEVQELVDQSIECSRTLTGELSPPVLYQGGSCRPWNGWSSGSSRSTV